MRRLSDAKKSLLANGRCVKVELILKKKTKDKNEQHKKIKKRLQARIKVVKIE